MIRFGHHGRSLSGEELKKILDKAKDDFTTFVRIMYEGMSSFY